MTGIAIIGMTTAARQLLEAAREARTDEDTAAAMLADAIECARQSYRALTGIEYATEVSL